MKKFLLTPLLLLAMALPALAATANPSPASSGYMVLPLSFDRQITATATPIKFKLPFACQVVGVTASAVTLDKTTTDETYTVDVKEGSTSILSSAITLTAAGTFYDGTVSDDTLADESTISVVFTLGGTTPIMTDAMVTLVLKRL